MLRVCGHSDGNIQAMLRGRPLCFTNDALFDELRSALGKLAQDLENELSWRNVNFVFTGSSVPGFSQNPLKGFKDTASKITSTTKSDVDICVLADGVNDWVISQRAKDLPEPKRSYPTTCSRTVCGMRFGVKDLSSVSATVKAFHDEWSTKLQGGLQLTFCEDSLDIPPWEARINTTSAPST
mmetsp:Transcript_4631/g.7572  ORF Transcript_4631/g.7572 Transcript_4631/m.7572 type:complete len:182 (-) Transcript_4631:226-771(-)